MSSKKATNNKGRKQNWISSHIGQRFFNFAYSIGAAIVIWGALFKILHLPGGNTLLSIGMAFEVLMFILTAFDRPRRSTNGNVFIPNLTTNTAATKLLTRVKSATPTSTQTPKALPRTKHRPPSAKPALAVAAW